MKNSLIFSSLVLLLVSCATATPSTEQAEREVRQASDELFAARERGDAAAFAAQFTDDGIYMVPGLKDSVGRTAIQELAQVRFAGTKTTDLTIHRREIAVHDDSAHELAWFTETTRSEDSGYRMQGRYVIVWKRGGGDAWKVHRYLYAFSGAEPLP